MIDKQELKNRALLERVSILTTEYENRCADLRVELTIQAQELGELKDENERLVKDLELLNASVEDDAEDVS